MRRKILELIKETLPEFEQVASKRAYRGGRRVSWIRQRSDALFERLFIDFYTGENREALGLQLSVSYFPECPIPSGPFGYDAPFNYVVEADLRDKLYKYYYGAGWYEVKTSDESTELFFELFREALLECVRPTLEDWAGKLLADDLLRIAVGSYWEMEREKKSLEEAEEVFSRRLDKIGPNSVEGYSIPKIKLQLMTRLKGLKIWHQV